MSELTEFLNSSGFASIHWQQIIMIAVGLGFILLAIWKEMEPYELLPIGLGIIVANLPVTGMTDFSLDPNAHQGSGIFGLVFHYGLSFLSLIHI